MRARQWVVFASLAASVLFLVSVTGKSQDQGQVREFNVSGNAFAFSPSSLTVNKNDLVKITFTAHDIAHSFTIDDYRIVKRAGAGQTVTFEFRADQPGESEFYCNLTADDRCRNMKGRLIVK
jgi:heme/copper-type cytochrome/quinol oxidase subunit 2